MDPFSKSSATQASTMHKHIVSTYVHIHKHRYTQCTHTYTHMHTDVDSTHHVHYTPCTHHAHTCTHHAHTCTHRCTHIYIVHTMHIIIVHRCTQIYYGERGVRTHDVQIMILLFYQLNYLASALYNL